MIEAYLVRADWFNIIAAGVMCLLQIGDWWTTKQFLNYGGKEGNPIGEMLIEKIGIDATGVLKILIATPFLIYANIWQISIGMNAFMLYVVISNYKYLTKLKEHIKTRLTTL